MHWVERLQMFGPDAPPLPWDSKGEYTRQRLRLYYCSNVGTVLKEAQVVEALQGQYPSNYVELGVQVLLAVCRISSALASSYHTMSHPNWHTAASHAYSMQPGTFLLCHAM